MARCFPVKSAGPAALRERRTRHSTPIVSEITVAMIRVAQLLLLLGLVGCGGSPWETMTTAPPDAESPEALFDEIIKAANSRNLEKFYGCLTSEAREDQIELMMHDLGRGGHLAKDKSDQSGVDLSKMLATPQTALAVIDKYKLPRDREIKLNELPTEDFDAFVVDMWHALQSKRKPYIDQDAAMLKLQDHGSWACAEVSTVPNRHGDTLSYIYFRKVNGQWRVEMSPWWYPWAEEPRLLNKEEKLRLPMK